MVNIESQRTQSIKDPIAKRNIKYPASKESQRKKRKISEDCVGDTNVSFAASSSTPSLVPDHEPQKKKRKKKKFHDWKLGNKEGKDNEQKKDRLNQVLKKIHLLELENIKLKTQREKNQLQAELTKKDLQSQILRLKNKLNDKHQAHSMELNLARANIKKAQIRLQKTYVEVCNSKKRQFPWLYKTSFCNIPDDIIRKMTGYLDDDDLFTARFLNRIFYDSFYGQRVSSRKKYRFHFERALKLAKLGRIFRNLEYFKLRYNCEKCVDCLNGLHFPSLKYLDVYRDAEKVPRNVNIKTVRCAESPNRGWWFSRHKFPNIEELIWAVDECDQGTGWLPWLKIIRFEFYHLNWWKRITEKKYPSLKKVIFNSEGMESFCDAYDVHIQDLQAARNYLERDFDAGIVMMRAQGVTVSEM